MYLLGANVTPGTYFLKEFFLFTTAFIFTHGTSFFGEHSNRLWISKIKIEISLGSIVKTFLIKTKSKCCSQYICTYEWMSKSTVS